ncbi:MAG: hypothetical protein AAGA60_06260 [Cyanobacteria bacterium P01_E01_bin.42]
MKSRKCLEVIGFWGIVVEGRSLFWAIGNYFSSYILKKDIQSKHLTLPN